MSTASNESSRELADTQFDIGRGADESGDDLAETRFARDEPASDDGFSNLDQETRLGDAELPKAPEQAVPDQLGQYAVQRLLGKGAQGAVYRGIQLSMNRPVALKVISPALASEPEYVLRFHREARLAARLQHPNVVGIYDSGSNQGWHWLAMELVEGPSVADVLRHRGPLGQEEALKIVRAVAAGLGCAHEAGILHRDVKPENVLVDADGTPKLADLGLARANAEKQNLTVTGMVMGTPFYISPEMVLGEPMDGRSDIYSLGVMLYELVTNQLPLRGENAVQTMMRHTDTDIPAPSSANPEVTPEMDALVRVMANRDRDVRHRDAATLVRDVDAMLAGRTPPFARRAAVSLGESSSGAFGRPRPASRPISRPGTGPISRPATRPITRPFRRSSSGTIARVGSGSSGRISAVMAAPSGVEVVGGRTALKVAVVVALLIGAVACAVLLGQAWRQREQARLAAEAQLRAEARRDKRDKHVSLGAVFLGDGKLDRAIAELTSAIEIDPEHALAYCDRGRAREAQGDLTGAREDYDRAIELAPRQPLALRCRGRLRYDDGDVDGAIEDYNRALDIEPTSVVGLVNRGIAWRAKGEPERAIDDFDRALDHDPESSAAFTERGNARCDLDDLEGAVEDHTAAIKLAPLYALAFANRAVARRKMGDLEGALEDCTEAIKLDPATPAAYRNRSMIRFKRREYVEAIEDASAAIEHDPKDAKAYLNRAAARQRIGEVGAAVEDFTRAIQLAPRLAEPHFSRGNALHELGEHQRAIDDCTRAIELDPADFRPWVIRGQARAALNDGVGAIEDLERALELAPEAARAFVQQKLDELRDGG